MTIITALPQVRPLMVAAESGPFKGTGAANFVKALSCKIPANVLTPGAKLRYGGMISKYVATGGGHSIKTTISQGANEVQLSQATLNAGVLFANWEEELTFTLDRKAAYGDGPNVWGGNGTIATATAYTKWQGRASASAALSVRATSVSSGRSNSVNFVSHSAPPTVETKLIDFTQDCFLNFYLSATSPDVVEMSAAFAELLISGGLDYAAPNATIFAGHSFAEGTGSTAGNDVVSVLRGLRPLRPITNLGLGGQKYLLTDPSSFMQRLLADPRAKTRYLIIQGPENDNTGVAATFFANVDASLQALKAYRGGSMAGVMIANCVTEPGWSTSVNAAAIGFNALLAASQWAPIVADVYSTICTDSAGGAAYGGNAQASAYQSGDGAHLNNAGYAAEAPVFDAKITALSWI